MRKDIPFNDNWEFTPIWSEAFLLGGGHGQRVRLPHTNAVLPFNYTDENAYQTVCGYKRRFAFDPAWTGKRVFAVFSGAAHEATVYLNGVELCRHACGYTAFSVELQNLQQENTLAVRVDARESLDVPPFGFIIDYLTYGGLYREAALSVRSSCYIRDAFLATPTPVSVRCRVELDGPLPAGASLRCTVFDADGQARFSAAHDICRSNAEFTLDIPDAKPWTPDTPTLYQAVFTLCADGEALDCFKTRFGFRTAKFRTDGFYLNGERRKLRGLNRHQSYPYVGYAMPASMQRLDAEILKHELGVDAVRTSHYPQSQQFIDRCDELGILVFTEIPGWQHIGGEAWKEQALINVHEMVTQYRNHPSVVLWGVRINESADDDPFYRETNALCHALDDSRATGGVRNIEKSSLLEDVYTYNDFTAKGPNNRLKPKKAVTSDPKKPYLVSEYNGHMYPTKRYDDEEHRLEHAMRHANILASMYAAEDIAGCFGWCMFDYNTHRDCGSGDRVCYHGVTDMFRNSKLAAAVYASQADADTVGDVGEVSSMMQIGDHPAGELGAVWVFTNADSVRLYKGERYVGEYFPDQKRFAAMPHPPVCIDDRIGGLLESEEGCSARVAAQIKACLFAVERCGTGGLPLSYKLRLARLMLFHRLTYADGVRLYEKYIGDWGGAVSSWRFDMVRNGRVVKSVRRAADGVPQLHAEADHTQLREEGSWDAALVRITAVDAYGNLLPYAGHPIRLFVTGEIELIGPDIITLAGGASGVFVKTTGRTGNGTLRMEAEGLAPVTIAFSAATDGTSCGQQEK